MILMPVNVFFDWIVSDHVNKMVDLTENDTPIGGSAHISSFKNLYDIGVTSNAIQFIFLGFAIFTTLCFAGQFFVTIMTWYSKDKNKSTLLEILVWTSLFLNDLPHCIVTTMVVYGTGDVYVPYIYSTMLGVIGNYMIFIALSNMAAFYYPKVIICHGIVTVICFITQVVLVTKAI